MEKEPPKYWFGRSRANPNMRRGLFILLALAPLFTACSARTPAHSPAAPGASPIKTWKALRDDSIEKQRTDESCGSASAATILRAFYGVDASEPAIAQSVRAMGLEDGTFPKLSRTSFTDLAHAVKPYGFRAHGATLRFHDLASLRVPVIVPLRYRGQDHFSVVRGIRNDGLVWLGDPAWGNRKLTAHQFKALWAFGADGTGRILIIVPEDQRRRPVNAAFFAEPTVNSSMLAAIARAPIKPHSGAFQSPWGKSSGLGH